MRISFVIRAIDAATGVLHNVQSSTGAVVHEVIRGSEKMKAALAGTSDAAMKAGAATAGAGALMLGSLAKPIQAFSEMEETMTRARLPYMTAGGVDPVWKELEPIIERLGNQLPGTVADFGEMAGAMRSAGLDAKYIRDGGLEAAAALKILGRLSNEEAGFLSVQLGRALKVEGKDYTAFADQIQRTSFAAGIGIREIAAAAPYMGQQLQTMGIKGLSGAKGVFALMTMLKEAGVNGTEMGTSIGELIDRLPTIQDRLLYARGWRGNEARNIFEKYKLGDLGKQLFDQNGELKGATGEEKIQNLVATFDKINKAIQSPKDRLAMFSELLGDVGKRAGLGLTLEAYDAANAKIRDQADLQKRLQEVLKTLSSSWEALTGSVTSFLASAAAPLAPILVAISGNLNVLAGYLTDWTKAHPHLTGAVMGSVAATGILLVLVGGLTLAVGLLGKAFLSGVEGLGSWRKLLLLSRQAVRGLGTEAVLTKAKLSLLDKARWGFSTNWMNPKSWFGEDVWKRAGSLLKVPLTGGFWKSLGKGSLAVLKLPIKLVPSVGGANTLFSGAGLLGAGKGMLGAIQGIFLFPLKAIGAGIAALGGPVLLVIAAIAVAALLIYKYWEPIKGFFKGIWEGLKNNIDLIKPAWDGFAEAIAGVYKALASLVDIFVPVQAGQDGVNTSMQRGEAIGHGLAWVFGVIGTAATWVAHGVETVAIVVGTLIDAVVTLLKSVYHLATGNVKAAGADWVSFSDRFWKRLESSSMAPQGEAAEAAAKAVEAAGKPAKIAGKAGKSAAKAATQGESTTDEAGSAHVPKINDFLPAPKAAGGTVIHIEYAPKLEFKGSVSQEDKAWFEKQLDAHKTHLLRLIDEAMERRSRWNGGAKA